MRFGGAENSRRAAHLENFYRVAAAPPISTSSSTSTTTTKTTYFVMPSATLPPCLPLELALLTSSTLPSYPIPSLTEHLEALTAGDYEKILTSTLTSSLLAPPESADQSFVSYTSFISAAVSQSQAHPLELLVVGIAALNAYLQSTTTGPPLTLKESSLIPPHFSSTKQSLKQLREELIRQLSIDGAAPYNLLPHPVLFTLAKTILTSSIIYTKEAETGGKLTTAPWWRLRVNFAHQRILRESAGTLHTSIYEDLDTIESLLFPQNDSDMDSAWHTETLQSLFLTERSTIHSFYNDDKKVAKDLEQATAITGLQYAITGRMGKRTKFQVNDISQLVVLARSKEEYKDSTSTAARIKSTDVDAPASKQDEDSTGKPMPKEIDLNSDTLLDAISFTPATASVVAESDLPPALLSLDPSSQPTLHPIDTIILLHLAESIKNTNPADGLTREEMTPYAERSLQHATNWSIHTLALLVRSRLEAYRSKTVERSLLQLQVVVDQIIAATASVDNEAGVSTFLPKPKEDESAGASERLQYVFALGLPTRWEVEAELAARWVSMGGLRSAVEIYERLGMWAEVALCWAGVDKEDKAVSIVRKLLYEGDMPRSEFEEDNILEDEEEEIVITDDDEKEAVERSPPPSEAPRLWCILGDLENDPKFYEKAWEVSDKRYARAQRSLGVYYLRRREYQSAIEAFRLSLSVNQLNSATWFQCGCAMLEVQDWRGAVDAFRRVVGIDDTDAEAWSNLATALLRSGNAGIPTTAAENGTNGIILDDDEEEGVQVDSVVKDEKNVSREQALRALKRAVQLKHDNWRMWENVLVIAASLRPPSWSDMQVAIRRVIDIKGTKDGETCVDVELLDMLVAHVTENYQKEQAGLPKVTIDLVDNKVVPLITGNERLWGTVRRLAVWRGKYSTALEAQEKAFRVVSGRYDVRTDKKSWEDLVGATEEMVEAYRSFGPMERSEGLAAGSGEVVMKDWKFKARSLVRGVIGKGRKGGWEDEDGALWRKLEEMAEGLKN
ncbi:hypothetical protein TWF694_006839 [Orbilia ellipsospora]|uniref:TPR repeat-containing protein n=1 Tax=Orbilia ellipsospora TaxID=2528407 RepID=A0AAV9XLE0_9PEZI